MCQLFLYRICLAGDPRSVLRERRSLFCEQRSAIGNGQMRKITKKKARRMLAPAASLPAGRQGRENIAAQAARMLAAKREHSAASLPHLRKQKGRQRRRIALPACLPAQAGQSRRNSRSSFSSPIRNGSIMRIAEGLFYRAFGRRWLRPGAVFRYFGRRPYRQWCARLSECGDGLARSCPFYR